MSSIEPDIAKWDAWPPEKIATLLNGLEAPWYVAAGWAIDLFLGGQRREHEDIEIAVPNSRFDEVASALPGFEIFVITGPRRATAIEHARDQLATTHQTWFREPSTGLWRFDVFREPSDGDTWIYRRDPTIRLRYDEVIERTRDGIPYGRPEIILLFKAKHADETKNQQDFVAVLPKLDPERRRWLAAALRNVHPDHAWLAEL
jgi:hypothetical protein